MHNNNLPGNFYLNHQQRCYIACFIAIFLLAGCLSAIPNAAPNAELNEQSSAIAHATDAEVAPPSSVALVPPSDAIPPIDFDNLRTLSSEEQLRLVTLPARNVPDLSVRLRPDVDEVPLVVNQSTPNYAVGDKLGFWVHNPGSAENTQISATLVYKTDVAYAWVEDDQSIDQAALERSIDHFSTVIYPTVTKLFGHEWSPGVDNDPRLHILHTNKTGGGIAGYYSSADEYSKLANHFSNEKEMFYININQLNSAQGYTAYEQVLAHELQHMIHWNRDRNEGVWMNEGLSEYAQDVAGYPQDLSFARNFLAQPSTELNDWGTVNSSNLIHYGASYLFVRYLAQQYGVDFVGTVVGEPGNGINGIEQALQTYPIEKGRATTFDAIFADWVVANYADAPDATENTANKGRWGYAEFDPGEAASQPFSTMNTTVLNDSVGNYATDYFEISENLPFIIKFDGDVTTQLVPTSHYAGNFAAWSNRGDESNPRLTRQFDLSAIHAGEAITLSVAMWWDIEEGYDFGYVTASENGRKWQMLRGEQATDANISGSNFGVGYTGNSNGWVVETFDLSAYAGQKIWLRFETVSDDAVNRPGWLVDDVSIPAIHFFDGFEAPNPGWQSEGWLVTDNQLAQQWLVQVMEYEDGKLVDVKRPLIEAGKAQFTIRKLRGGKNVLAISGLTQGTTETANYQVNFEPAYE